MTTSTVAGELSLVFAEERAALQRARAAQRRKDTPANRAAVAACQAKLDAVLDTYLALNTASDGFDRPWCI